MSPGVLACAAPLSHCIQRASCAGARESPEYGQRYVSTEIRGVLPWPNSSKRGLLGYIAEWKAAWTVETIVPGLCSV
jgi:hypothetical protein